MALRSPFDVNQKLSKLFYIVYLAANKLNQDEVPTPFKLYDGTLDIIHREIVNIVINKFEKNISSLQQMLTQRFSFFADISQTKKIVDFIIENIISEIHARPFNILLDVISQKVTFLIRDLHLKKPISSEIIRNLIEENFQEYGEQYYFDLSNSYAIYEQKFRDLLSKDVLDNIDEARWIRKNLHNEFLNILKNKISQTEYNEVIAKYQTILEAAAGDPKNTPPQATDDLFLPIKKKLEDATAEWTRDKSAEVLDLVNVEKIKLQFTNSLTKEYFKKFDKPPTPIRAEIDRRIDEESKKEYTPETIRPKSKVESLLLAKDNHKLASFKLMLKNVNLREISSLEKNLGDDPVYRELVQQQRSALEFKVSKMPTNIFYHDANKFSEKDTSQNNLKLVI